LAKLSVMVTASTHPSTCLHLFLSDSNLDFQHFQNTLLFFLLCQAAAASHTLYAAYTNKIKLCLRGAQTCALPQFCDRDLEISPLTLKLKGDLHILKMYDNTKNKAASLRDSKVRA